jgi:iron complex outermembrane receptor protein
MNTENLLHQAVRGALAIGAGGALVGGGAAFAQTAAPAAGTTTNLSAITVTGSHIPQTAVATAQPVVTINRQQIESTGFTNVGQILQSLTSSGTALNETFNNGGNGSEAVNLHNLGSNRVLVLVNGQRWVNGTGGPHGLGGAVDLSSIPASIIQRVEVLLDGASAVYGSEAIAGVVNIITVKNFNGAEASAYFGEYDAKDDGGGWDGRTQKYSFTVGTSNDRSSVLLSAGYSEQNSIFAGERTISKEPYYGIGRYGGSASGPHGLYQIGLNPANIPPQFAGNGCGPTGFPVTTPASPGCSIAGPLKSANGITANPHPFGNTDLYNYAPTGYLHTPYEKWYIYSQGHYDISDNVSFHFTATYNDRTSNQTLAQNPFVFGAAGYTANGLPIGIAADNPYNPFGVDLVPTLSPKYSSSISDAFCSQFGSGGGANGCTPTVGHLFELAMRPLNLPLRTFSQDSKTYYFNGGFTGNWMMAGNQWTWNANYIYSDTTQTTITTGLANTAQIQKELGAGCTGTMGTDGCQALNLFSGARGMTPAQVNPILFTAHSVTQQKLRDYNLGIGGSFFNGWYAGPWGVAAGYEYDEVEGDFSPDAFISAGNTDGNIATATSGRAATDAEYAELTIPFGAGVPGFEKFSVDLANRWSQFHFNGIGNNFNPATKAITTGPSDRRATSSVGRVTVKWYPVDQLLIRAAWSQAFRIPSISELFGGAGTNYPAASDPCAPKPNGSYTGGPLPPGCNGLQHSQPSAQIMSNSGGNPDLKPENAITRTIGFVYSPKWAPGLNLQADYFKVEVDNLVIQPSAQFLLDSCYKKQEQSSCQRIKLQGPVVTRIFQLDINAGSETVEGVDGNINYTLPTTAVGQFKLGLGATFIRSDIFCDPAGNCSQGAGTAGVFTTEPRHRYNFSLDWSFGPWAVAYNAYLIGDVWENCANGQPQYTPGGTKYAVCSNPEKHNGPGDNPPSGQNHLGTTIYSDLQGSYTVNAWNTTFTLGVNNLFDKAPPIARAAFANSFYPMYRVPGRFVYGRVSVRF